MEIVRKRIPLSRVRSDYMHYFSSMTKLVVDVKRRILAIDAELHADQESALLEDGSQQQDLWGCNLYPGETGENRIEYTSLINIRPSQGNRSMEIEDSQVKTLVASVIGELIDYAA